MNDPVNFIDPAGKFAFLPAIAPALAALGNAAAYVGAGLAGYAAGSAASDYFNEQADGDDSDSSAADRPPPGSMPIDETPWSGDHGDIKDGLRLGGEDKVKISPDGDVWVQNPDGTWTNEGSAGNYTGSGKACGRRGKDRKRSS